MIENSLQDTISECARSAESRHDFWAKFLNSVGSKEVAEVGVWKGEFAAHILNECGSIGLYYMIDPWRHLDSWNKPANVGENTFEAILAEAINNTKFAEEKVSVLRGTTTEVIGTIPDESLDFAYIDGDHTLKGISIDLITSYPKVKPGGIIGGDDFTSNIWQHSPQFEPTLVFPFAVYFAEATRSSIYALPYSQFLIRKPTHTDQTFIFEDLTGIYSDLGLRNQFLRGEYLAKVVGDKIKTRVLSKLRKLADLIR